MIILNLFKQKEQYLYGTKQKLKVKL